MLAICERKGLLRARLGQDLLDSVPHLAVARLTPTDLLQRVVLVNELIDRHETSADPDDQIVLYALHDHLLFEIVVLAVTEPHKETLHLLLGSALVDEVSKLKVYLVTLDWHIFEIDFVEFVPVFKKFVELLILVLEQLHLFSRLEQLLPVSL